MTATDALEFRDETQRETYRSILRGETGLQAVERVILALAGYDSTDVYLYVMKPLIHSLVGHGRGYSTPDAATSETERYLRTSAAWDTVTDVWLAHLDQHDTGHPLPNPNRKDL